MITKLTRNRLILVAITISALVVGVILLNKIFNQPSRDTDGQFKILVEIAPSDASLKIDDKSYKSPAKLSLKPGKHHFKIERYGFKTIDRDFDITKDEEFPIGLQPITDEAKAWVNSHMEIYFKQQTKGSATAIASAEATGRKYPLLNYLPSPGGTYKIGHKRGPNDVVIITVHAPRKYFFLAIKYLMDFRLDLSLYRFEFIDKEQPGVELNPFKLETGTL